MCTASERRSPENLEMIEDCSFCETGLQKLRFRTAGKRRPPGTSRMQEPAGRDVRSRWRRCAGGRRGRGDTVGGAALLSRERVGCASGARVGAAAAFWAASAARLQLSEALQQRLMPQIATSASPAVVLAAWTDLPQARRWPWERREQNAAAQKHDSPTAVLEDRVLRDPRVDRTAL